MHLLNVVNTAQNMAVMFKYGNWNRSFQASDTYQLWQTYSSKETCTVAHIQNVIALCVLQSLRYYIFQTSIALTEILRG